MRTTYYDSVRVFEPETAQITDALDKYVRALASKPEVLVVWLIGSFHRKDFGPFSDVDLVLIVDSITTRFVDRSLQYLPESFPVSIDLFVYCRQEVEDMKSSSHPFWIHLEQNHTVLFER